MFRARDFAHVVHTISRSLTGKVRAFTETYMNMFLSESIKTIIRGLDAGLDRDEILRFTVPTSPEQLGEFDLLVDSGSVNDMIDRLPYWGPRIALLTRLPKYEELESTAPLEVAVEEWYLRELSTALKRFSSGERLRVLSIIEPRVDLRNVLTMFRAFIMGWSSEAIGPSLVRFTGKSRQIVETIRTSTGWREMLDRLRGTRYARLAGRIARLYEESNNLIEVELAIEDYIAQRVRLQFTAFPFHLGTVIAFFGLKWYEVRNIRSIAVGVERGESAETIRRMITLW